MQTVSCHDRHPRPHPSPEDVLERTGLSRTTMYRKMQNGTFPKSVQISIRCAGWRESAVNEWLNNPMFYLN
jgi:prophage regulatory protein